jgi:hypothetical protein
MGFPIEISILAKQGELDGLRPEDFSAAEAEGEQT